MAEIHIDEWLLMIASVSSARCGSYNCCALLVPHKINTKAHICVWQSCLDETCIR